MTDSTCITAVRVGECEIRDDKLRQQQSRKHRAMNDSTRALFIPAQCLQPALLNRRFDRLVVDLIKINHYTAFEICLLAKWHVHKTEGAVVHRFGFCGVCSLSD